MYIAQIEAEVGRINFDIPDSVASHMTPKEYVRSLCFEELSMAHSAAHSYRMAVKLLNRTLHRDAGMEVKTSTLNEHVESMGRKATAYLSDKAVEILETHLWQKNLITICYLLFRFVMAVLGRMYFMWMKIEIFPCGHLIM